MILQPRLGTYVPGSDFYTLKGRGCHCMICEKVKV